MDTGPVDTGPPLSAAGRRSLVVAVLTAALTGGLAVAGGALLGLPLHDPDGFLGPTWVRLPLITAVGLAVDVVPRAAWRARRCPRPSSLRDAVLEVVRTRWPVGRLVPVLVAVAGFYVTYVGYRNLKNFLPFVHEPPQDLHLVAVDHALALGHNPAAVLHAVLGTGIAAHVLSGAYMAFLVLVPVSVVAALMWSRDLSHGLWYVSALCVNWALGTASYYLVPSSGPFWALPWDFTALPRTDAGALQVSLLRARARVLADPHATTSVSGIAAFASLHVSITFTAALLAQVLRLPAVVRGTAWGYFALVALATVYFGWHYLADDLAGLGIGAASVGLGAGATGRLRPPARPPVPPVPPVREHAATG